MYGLWAMFSRSTFAVLFEKRAIALGSFALALFTLRLGGGVITIIRRATGYAYCLVSRFYS